MTAPAFRELAELVPCPRCMALVGEPCRTDGSRGGTPRSCYPHEVRSRPTMDAWRAGFTDGVAEGLLSVDWRARQPRPRFTPTGFEVLEQLLLEIANAWQLEDFAKRLVR